jgi:hypothetical protein
MIEDYVIQKLAGTLQKRILFMKRSISEDKTAIEKTLIWVPYVDNRARRRGVFYPNTIRDETLQEWIERNKITE